MKLLVLREIVKRVAIIGDVQCIDAEHDGAEKNINQLLKNSQSNGKF